MKKIIAMILAGGRVDELDILTLNRPKSAVPFGGTYRVIDFPLSNLMHSGIEKVGVLLQYRSSSLITHLGNGASWDMVGRNRGVFVLPPFKAASSFSWYNGTADAILQNFDFINEFQPDLVLVLSGDHIYKMNYIPLIQYHENKNADLTVVFTKVDKAHAHRFGIADIDNEDGDAGGRINHYWEKPEQPSSQWASLTIYLIRTHILKRIIEEGIQPQGSFEFGKHLIPYMLDHHYKVYGYKFHDYWGYTRTVAEFWQSNMDILGDNPRIEIENWELRTNLDHRSIRDRMPTIISSEATVENCIIPQGCKIEGHVMNSVLFPGVIIGRGSKVQDSILMFDSHIYKNVTIEHAIVDTDVTVNSGAQIGNTNDQPDIAAEQKFTIIGAYSVIPSDIRIGENCIVYPNKKLADFSKSIIHPGEIVK